MLWGNKPTDGGNFILSKEERFELIAAEPEAKSFIRPYISGKDFIDGDTRYCLWLKDVDPKVIRSMPRVSARVQAVKEFRLKSDAPSTRAFADYPTLFRQIAQPNSDYLAIPEVSSERRKYIAMAFVSKKIVCSNAVQFIPNATLYHFGMLESALHMAWVRSVAGKLKSDFRYSNTIVYNNFPWPESPTDKQKLGIESAAQGVLDARAEFSKSSLADLYDPLAMPPPLSKAHQKLDAAVDAAYGKKSFKSDAERVAFLFTLYQKYTSLLPAETVVKRRKANKASV